MSNAPTIHGYTEHIPVVAGDKQWFMVSVNPPSVSSFSLLTDFMLASEEATGNYPTPAEPKLRADMTFFETPAGGTVFSAGSIGFAAAFAHNDCDNDVCRIATNVLQNFVDDEEPFWIPTE